MKRIEYDLAEEDFMRYAQHHFSKSADAKASFRRTMIIGLGALLVYALSIKDDPIFGLHAPALYAVRVASVIAVFLGCITAYHRIIRPMLVRGWLRSAAKRSLGHTTLVLDGEGVQVANVDGQGRLAWPACRGVVNDTDHIYLIMAPLRALVVPKRAFPEAAEAEAFFAEAHEHYASTRADTLRKR